MSYQVLFFAFVIISHFSFQAKERVNSWILGRPLMFYQPWQWCLGLTSRGNAQIWVRRKSTVSHKYLFNERRLQALLLLFFFVIGVASVDTGPKLVNVTIQIDGGDIFTGVDQTFPSVTINEGQSLLVALETLQRTNSNFQ